MTEHERAVIGSMLRKPTLYDDAGLAADDFGDPLARAVHRAIGEVLEAGATPDIVSVSDRLPDHRAEIAALTDGPFVAGNLRYYRDRIREAAKERQADKGLLRLQDARREGLEPFQEELERLSMDLAGEHRAHGPRPLRDALPVATAELEQRVKNGGAGVSWGLAVLDRTIGRLRAGDLVILAARTSVGKTALALSLAHGMRYPVGYFTLEMDSPQIAERLIGMEAKISTLRPTRDDFTVITSACDRLSGRTIYLDDTPALSLPLLRSRARWMVRRGCMVLFVDYLTLIRHGDPKTPRHERIGEIAKSLKSLARELGVPIVALSQINRLAEGTMPGLENLRQSGELEEDADVVLLLHRKRGEEDATLRIGKNRRGRTGDVGLRFVAETVAFEESR